MNKRMVTLSAALCAVALCVGGLLVSTAEAAGFPTGPLTGDTIAGRVIDQGGAPVANAIVELQAGKATQAVRTDASGNFSFTGLGVGTYKVSTCNGAVAQRVQLACCDVFVTLKSTCN